MDTDDVGKGSHHQLRKSIIFPVLKQIASRSLLSENSPSELKNH
jgi:hypothetical protein